MKFYCLNAISWIVTLIVAVFNGITLDNIAYWILIACMCGSFISCNEVKKKEDD